MKRGVHANYKSLARSSPRHGFRPDLPDDEVYYRLVLDIAANAGWPEVWRSDFPVRNCSKHLVSPLTLTVLERISEV